MIGHLGEMRVNIRKPIHPSPKLCTLNERKSGEIIFKFKVMIPFLLLLNFRHDKVGIVNKLLFCFISILKYFEKHSFTGVIIDGWNHFLVAFFIFRFTSTHQNENMRERFCLVCRINSSLSKGAIER